MNENGELLLLLIATLSKEMDPRLREDDGLCVSASLWVEKACLTFHPSPFD